MFKATPSWAVLRESGFGGEQKWRGPHFLHKHTSKARELSIKSYLLFGRSEPAPYYFVADFFSSTRMTSIGPLPMFSGRCAPAGEKTASPFFP